MVEVMRLKFKKDIVYDDTIGKFRYLGKASDRFGHTCPIGKKTAQWCLELCEFARSAPLPEGFSLVCAYAKITGQTVRESLESIKMHPDDLIAEVGDGMDWWLNEKRDVQQVQTFKPTPENPYGYTILGLEPWKYGIVERPVLDPELKRPKYKPGPIEIIGRKKR